jgi:outer membrane protein OmpA-like peptidoglycan-associated protein
MNRNLAGASSAILMLVCLAGFPQAGIAHEDKNLCNVLLDGDGEPVRERDSDSIAHGNTFDCPEEGADEAASVENVAAPAPEPVEAPVAVVEPLVVYFDVNEKSVDAGSRAEVNAYVVSLLATAPETLNVVGYTDTSGSVELNRRLSEARADSVSAALIDAGVPAGMITRGASGESELAVATPDGTREASNRRVTVTPGY